ncbi:MAG: hypothetical protein WBL95_18095 [Microcoleus sp.]
MLISLAFFRKLRHDERQFDRPQISNLKYSGFMNEVRYRRQLAMHFYEKETSMLNAPCPMPNAHEHPIYLRKAID